MSSENQYLAPLQSMLDLDHPEWVIAVDTYFRLRAIEVAWRMQTRPPKLKPGIIDIETLHRDFLDSHKTAVKAKNRFFQSNDQLSRLMSSVEKELAKFKEHVIDPVSFYDENREEIEEAWKIGRPNRADLSSLGPFLTETFLEAGNWLIENNQKSKR